MQRRRERRRVWRAGSETEVRSKALQHLQEQHGVLVRRDSIRCPVPETDQALSVLALTGPRK
eukprot:1293251-Alexandrium_andersonii.AAC.1